MEKKPNHLDARMLDRFNGNRNGSLPSSAQQQQHYGNGDLAQMHQSAAGGREPRDSTLGDYIGVLRRGFILIAGFTLLGSLLGYLVSLPQANIYRATTSIEVQEPNEGLLDTKDVSPTTRSPLGGSFLETQMRVLQSLSLRNSVVKEESAKPREIIALPDRLSSLLKGFGLPPFRKPPTAHEAFRMANNDLQIRQLGTSLILQIQSESTDPRVAATFTNALVEKFQEQNLTSRSLNSSSTVEWLDRQVAELRRQLQDSETQLENYVKTSGLLLSQESGNLVEDHLRSIQHSLESAQSDRMDKDAKHRVAQVANIETLPEVTNDPALRALQAKISDAKLRLLELSSIFTPEYYKVKQLREQITDMEATLDKERKSIVTRIANEYTAAVQREQMVNGSYRDQVKLLTDQRPLLAKYNVLKQEVQSNRIVYESMLQKVKTLRIAGMLRASTIRILDPAVPSSQPVRPDVGRNIITGLITAMFIGVVICFVRDQKNRTVGAPEDIQWNVPDLGAILSVKPNRLLSADDQSAELVAWRQKPSVQAESVRSVVASILAWRSDKTVLVVTSASPGEGKTSVTSNVAAALADANRRVLIIDADLHNPQMHKVFGLPNTWGLSDLANDSLQVKSYPMKNIVRATAVDNVFVLVSGPAVISTSGLLHSRVFSFLMRRFRKEFDFVLIDTPPMMETTDARVLAHLSDGVVLVIRAGKTSMQMAEAALQRLADDGAHIVGTVLNDFNPPERHPYGGYYQQRIYPAGRRFFKDS